MDRRERQPRIYGSDQLVVWAELTGEPTEFEMPADHPDWTTTVVLEPEMYSVSCTATTEGSAFEVKCGNVSTGFALIDNGQGGTMSAAHAEHVALRFFR